MPIVIADINRTPLALTGLSFVKFTPLMFYSNALNMFFCLFSELPTEEGKPRDGRHNAKYLRKNQKH